MLISKSKYVHIEKELFLEILYFLYYLMQQLSSPQSEVDWD